MTDGDGERVRGVERHRNRRHAEQEADHPAQRFLLRPPVPADRLLNEARGVLMDRDPTALHRQQHDAPDMPQLEGNLTVTGMKQVLNRRLVGACPGHERLEGGKQVRQAIVKRQAARRRDGAEVDGPKPAGPALDQSVSGGGRAGINPQNEQAVRRRRGPR